MRAEDVLTQHLPRGCHVVSLVHVLRRYRCGTITLCGGLAQMTLHFIGTAGWSVARTLPQFPQDGSALARYAAVFSATEINSSFYRRHRQSTWQRWHDAVPPSFRFSVKLPRTMTHERGLVVCAEELDLFFDDVAPLGDKLGALLIQLPPKLAFQPVEQTSFFAALRERSDVAAFIEPRHDSWAAPKATALLQDFRVGRVLADPQLDALQAAAESEPARYLRLHGSPRIYYSAYSDEQLRHFAERLDQTGQSGWCIFDNTASGAATENALRLQEMLDSSA